MLVKPPNAMRTAYCVRRKKYVAHKRVPFGAGAHRMLRFGGSNHFSLVLSGFQLEKNIYFLGRIFLYGCSTIRTGKFDAPGGLNVSQSD